MDLENKEVMQTDAEATDIKVARHVGVVNSSTFSTMPSSSTKNKKICISAVIKDKVRVEAARSGVFEDAEWRHARYSLKYL